MLTKINHIGIAVKDLDNSVEIFRKLFQFNEIHKEIVPMQKVKIASFKVGEVLIELTQPTADDSPISKFMEKKGEGIHHIGFESDEIQKDLDRLKDEGINLINDKPVDGAHEMLIAFLHPKSTNGVLTEICQSK